jgi:Lon protease-like protein
MAFFPCRFEVRYLDMINKCIANGTQFGVVSLTQESKVRQPGVTETLAAVGTLARINSWHAPLPGLLQIICTGTMRFHVASSKQLKHGLWVAEVVQIENDQAISIPDELQDTADALSNLIVSMQNEGVSANDAPVIQPYRLDECGWVANRWCELLPLTPEKKLHLLALDNRAENRRS